MIPTHPLTITNYKIVGGIKPGSPCQCLRWAQGLIRGRPTPWPWEGSSSAMRRTLLGHKCSRGQKGANQSWWRHSGSFRRTGKVLERQRTREKLPLLQQSTLHLTELCFSAFTTTPNHFGYGRMGWVSALKRWTYMWTFMGVEKASIKGGRSSPKEEEVQQPEPPRPCLGDSLLG